MTDTANAKPMSSLLAKSSLPSSPTKALATILITLLACISLFACAGCSSENSQTGSQSGEGADAAQTVRIGTMPTEDILPMWVAEQEDYFADLDFAVEIIEFDSAQALSAAIAANEVDMAMTDVMRAVRLNEADSPVTLEWITLGTEASQGRFGILAGADAPYDTLADMAIYAADHPDEDVFVGVGANTVPEYVFDELMVEAELDADSIKTTEVASLPERFSLVSSGNLAAAALPNSLLTLGEAQGMKVLAEDTSGLNISQSVMVARASFAADHEDQIIEIAKVWDRAAEFIAANPDAALEILSNNASLNSQIKDIYVLSEYPSALSEDGTLLAHPAAELVEPQIAWMQSKSYGGEGVSYSEMDGAIN